jgi:hypothetical protein
MTISRDGIHQEATFKGYTTRPSVGRAKNSARYSSVLTLTFVSVIPGTERSEVARNLVNSGVRSGEKLWLLDSGFATSKSAFADLDRAPEMTAV